MKKRFLLVISLFLFIFTTMIVLSENVSSLDNMSETERVDLAYSCLLDEINKKNCSRLSLEEQIFSLLSVGECYDEVMDASRLNECWPKTGCDIKTTSLAVLALDNYGENTEKGVNWILSQNLTSTNLKWYLQVNINEEANCTLFNYEEEFKFKLDAKGTFIEGSGESSCFSIEENYGIKIDESCYNSKLEVSCDSAFRTSLLFKKENSNLIFVSDLSKKGNSNEKVTINVKSLCSGNEACEYEDTLWASLALDITGNEISYYLSHLIAFEEENEELIPESFLYFFTGEKVYFSNLFSKQNEKGYWDYSGNKYYDTSIALLPFANDNLETKNEAIEWLKKEQGSSGCWDGWDIKETAFILFSVWPKYPLEKNIELLDSNTNKSSYDEGNLEEKDFLICEDNGGFCMSKSRCGDSQGEILEDYECKGWDSCCDKDESEFFCSDVGGTICNSQEECSGVYENSVLEERCCIKGTCNPINNEASSEKSFEKSECEINSGSCKSNCLETEMETIYSCAENSDKCCIQKKDKKSYWWLWVLFALIVLATLGILFKDKVREFILRIKTKGGNKEGFPGRGNIPPRGPPGYPRRPMPPKKIMPRPSPQNSNIPGKPRAPINKPLPNSRNKELDDVLKKLKEMGE